MTDKTLKVIEDKLPVCPLCQEQFDPRYELFSKHIPTLCSGCDRENYEDMIGYENN